MGCGVGASGMPRPTRDCTARRGAVAPVLHWLMVYAVHPARVAARTMALGRGLRHLRMALWDAGGVSPAATGDRGVAPGPRDLGCTPLVGKSGRRGILRQAKVWLRRHTGCMTRRHTAGMAEKARRAPQTHGWWAALTRKKSSKTFYFRTIGGFTAQKTGHAANHRGAPGGGITKIIDEWPYRFYRRCRPVPYPAG